MSSRHEFSEGIAAMRGYPRPQMMRATWQSLDGPWKFTFDDEGAYKTPQDVVEWRQSIEVPFAPESKRSGIGDTGYHPNCWYEREFEVMPGKGDVLLHFGAVDYRAYVWINDHFAGEHEGGFTPFTFNISRFLKESGPQKITVWAEDPPMDLAKPRGKQDWQLDSHSIWYPRTSGIWQTVWLERVQETHIDHIRWTPHLERWEIGFEAFIKGSCEPGMVVKVSLSKDNQLLARDTYEVIIGEVHRRIALSDPGIDDFRNELLWSPEKPTLIQAEIELWKGGELVDRISSYTALRSVTIQRDQFMLNGKPYYLRLVLNQGYFPDCLMTAPNTEAFETDVQIVKAMGFNGVRMHQKIESPQFLYWADVLGLLVWEEMPSSYRFTHESVERITRQWIEVIDRDYSHPCIVTWVPFNESWGVPDLVEKDAHRHCVQALYHLTKTLDPTRPVLGNDGWESTATDIIGIHDYDGKPHRLAKRYGPHVDLTDLFQRKRPGGRFLTLDGYPHQGQPVMLTEFGGIACTRCDKNPDKRAWGYTTTNSAVELRQKFSAILRAVHRVELFSGYCYTQFADTFQEANGLVFEDRTPKIPLEEIARIITGRDFEDEGDETGDSHFSRCFPGLSEGERQGPHGSPMDA